MTDNEKLRNIAIKILSKTNLPKDHNYGFPSLTILMVISIILTCIRILQECNKNKLSNTYYTAEDKYGLYSEQIRAYSTGRGWFTKMRIKKILRKEMSKEDYNRYSISILSALLDLGEVLTDDEVITLVEAANV